MRTEQDAINDTNKLYGIKSADKLVMDFEEVKTCMDLYISSVLPTGNSISSQAINPKKIVKKAREIFLKLLPNVNRDILYISSKDAAYLQAQAIKNNYSEDRFISRYNSLAILIDIFDIPVDFTNATERFGVAKNANLLSSDESLLRCIKLIASEIELKGPSDYLTVITYLHELIHLFIKRFKGIIGDYYYQEFLSIFFERVFALHFDDSEILLSKELLKRNIHLKQITDIILKGNDSIDKNGHNYLISTLLANILFYRYYHATDKDRKEILLSVEMILNGEKSIPEFLIEQGISLSSDEVVAATQFTIDKSLNLEEQKLERISSNKN